MVAPRDKILVRNITGRSVKTANINQGTILKVDAVGIYDVDNAVSSELSENLSRIRTENSIQDPGGRAGLDEDHALRRANVEAAVVDDRPVTGADGRNVTDLINRRRFADFEIDTVDDPAIRWGPQRAICLCRSYA